MTIPLLFLPTEKMMKSLLYLLKLIKLNLCKLSMTAGRQQLLHWSSTYQVLYRMSPARLYHTSTTLHSLKMVKKYHYRLLSTLLTLVESPEAGESSTKQQEIWRNLRKKHHISKTIIRPMLFKRKN